MIKPDLYGRRKRIIDGIFVFCSGIFLIVWRFEMEQLGQKLLKEKVVTEEQLEKAVERQRLQGGRLGHNLVALGFITTEELKAFFKRYPKAPKTVEDTGLELSFIGENYFVEM
jgi:hypothetical protein